jgi:hypothetical protein
MKIKELLYEDLTRISQRNKPNPTWTSFEVVKRILKDYGVTYDEPGGEADENPPDDYRGTASVGPSWAKDPITNKKTGIYDPFGSFPGEGGSIGLSNPQGRTPDDIAAAAHEAYHALLQMRHKNHNNERVVNRLAVRWLQDHYSGKFLHFAINVLRDSRVSYKDEKYQSSKKHLKHERDFFNSMYSGRKKPWF